MVVSTLVTHVGGTETCGLSTHVIETDCDGVYSAQMIRTYYDVVIPRRSLTAKPPLCTLRICMLLSYKILHGLLNLADSAPIYSMCAPFRGWGACRPAMAYVVTSTPITNSKDTTPINSPVINPPEMVLTPQPCGTETQWLLQEDFHTVKAQ